MKRLTRWLLMAAALIAEPALHLLGIPHPEGLSAHAANLLVTLEV